MNSYTLSLCKQNIYLTLLATLVQPTISNAETYDFKVVYVEVPGINEILAGDHDAAIKILESRAKDSSNYYLVDEMSTLCGLYVLKGRFAIARETCNIAVETDRSHTAYNNRGVLRVHLGDTAGAMEDFGHAKVSPENHQRYIKEIMMGDARLIATSNYAVAVKFAARYRPDPAQSLVNSIRGANVEDLGNQ